MKVLKMEEYGLMPLSDADFCTINGGEWPTWVKSAGLVGLANEVVKNWDDIKGGFLAGWNSLK